MMATAMRQIPKMVAEVAMKSCILTFGLRIIIKNKPLSNPPLKGENKTLPDPPLKGGNPKSPFKGDLEGLFGRTCPTNGKKM